MNDSFLRLILIGSLFSTVGACTAGNYDLPACEAAEKCGNGIDDDCDGVRDNPELCDCTKIGEIRDCPVRPGIITNVTNPASICTPETQFCRNNLQWSQCSGVEPSLELCANGFDDDCDGTVDDSDPEGCIPCIQGQTQYIATPGLSYRPESICKIGIQDCVDGAWISRPGLEPKGPRPTDDNCDGMDDDCDGRIDDDAKWGTFSMGAPCWDASVQGACRTRGTVACNASNTAICNRMMQTPDTTNFHNMPAANVYTDAMTSDAAWDWNCDGKIDSIFATGTASVRTGSNISKAIYVVLDDATNCSITRAITGCNSVIIKSTDINSFIKCGSEVTVTECEIDPFNIVTCRNKGNPQNGFLYCR